MDSGQWTGGPQSGSSDLTAAAPQRSAGGSRVARRTAHRPSSSVAPSHSGFADGPRRIQTTGSARARQPAPGTRWPTRKVTTTTAARRLPAAYGGSAEPSCGYLTARDSSRMAPAGVRPALQQPGQTDGVWQSAGRHRVAPGRARSSTQRSWSRDQETERCPAPAPVEAVLRCRWSCGVTGGGRRFHRAEPHPALIGAD